MSFAAYKHYKPSGLTWLPEVPESWRVIAPKRCIRSAAGGTLIKGQCASEQGEGLYQGFSASGPDVWLEQFDYDQSGIVVSAVGARCGKAFKADGRWGVVANTHCLFPDKNMNRDFVWYLTNSEDWWEKGGTAQPFVRVSELFHDLGHSRLSPNKQPSQPFLIARRLRSMGWWQSSGS